jgi:predicted ATP-dependent serine protease
MKRTITIRNIYQKEHETLALDGIWLDVLGEPESNGAWLIYGRDKNGKTWLALTLALYLSTMKKVLYISAEEGIGLAFKNTLQRVGANTDNNNLHLLEYESFEDLDERLGKRRSPDVVFIDNLTIYQDEVKKSTLTSFLARHKTKLIVFLAHEERGEPYTAAARLISKLAKVRFQVRGLQCNVNGRVPGGVLMIDEKKAQLFHGTNTPE